LLDKIYSKDAIKKYNIKGRRYNEELLKKCQPGFKPNPDIGRTIYLPYTRVRISLRCLGWYDTCSICPFGAIKFDARNKCYVDKELCRGASYKKGAYAGGHFARLEETQCWNCFTGAETAGEWHSRNCLQRRLKKVCSVDTAACCAICSLGSKLVDSLDLMDLCPYGAISDSGGGFIVDPAVCVGCMACYNGITCYLNTSDDVPDLTVRMVSYIER